MAAWNEKNEGDELEECNICLCQVAKKRLTVHTTKCVEAYEDRFETEAMGFLMRCPLYPMHIIPRAYMNHHLEYNCEEAQNLLRKFFQKEEFRQESTNLMPPEHFLADIPDEVLNQNNKRLLYMLQCDFDGKSLASDTNLYREISTQPMVQEESATPTAIESVESSLRIEEVNDSQIG